MFDPKIIDNLANRIADIVPPGLNHLKEDMDKNVHAILQRFDKLDLVSREEFEVQKAVLAKTRAKLEALEKQVAALENHLPEE